MQGKFIAFCVAVVALAAACSTDVEVNAPYDSRTVIYGILDPSLDTQYVKINRTWLGPGNNTDIAMIRDSSEYPEGSFDARIEALFNGSPVASYPLLDTLLDDKDPNGIFFAPEHTAYYCLTPDGLEPGFDYRISIDFTDGREVSASTDVIENNPGAITFPPPGNSSFKLNWASVTSNGTTYFNQTFKWTSAPNARRYEGTLLIHFIERVYSDANHTNLLEERPVTLEWRLGTVQTADADGGETMTLPVNGQSFYRFLESRLTPDPNIRREFGIWDPVEQISRAFDFVLTIANDDFNTYLDVNEPVTNIVQERPQYTNVENGLGIFASRLNQEVLGVGINEGSIVSLVQGPFTANLNFCSSNPFNQFYCGE